MDSPPEGNRTAVPQPRGTTPATESSGSNADTSPSSGDGSPTSQRPRYDTPPQNVSELGAITNPYDMMRYHQPYIPVHMASDQPAAKRLPIAYQPVQVSYPHQLSHAAPRIEYLHALAPRNPYIRRADEIGLYHNIPGLGHLGLDIVPPKPWKAGDDPVNPEEALYLFEKSRERARIEHDKLDIASMSSEERAKSHEVWLRDLRKDELILHHRLGIWNEFAEKQATSKRQHNQLQSSFGPAYSPRSYEYFHSPSQTTDFQQQRVEPSNDLPNPSGLDPYLIRQSVESAINRFQDQQTEMELKRLQSEMQLGHVLDHFRDHIGEKPSAPPQSGAPAITEVDPTGQEDGMSTRQSLASSAMGTLTTSSPRSAHPATPQIYRALDPNPSHGPYKLPLLRTVHDQSPVVDTTYIPTESQNIRWWSPARGSFGGNEVLAQDTARDLLYSAPIHQQSIGQRNPPTPPHEASGSSFPPTESQIANRWTQIPQQAGSDVERIIEGDSPSGSVSANAEQHQTYLLHGGMRQGLSLGTPHHAEMRPATGPRGRQKGATTKLEKTTNRAPRKRKEKKETWYNRYIQDIKHPTNVPSKEYMETTLADAQLARDAKPRTRKRRTTPKFDEKKGFLVKQSLANDLVNRGVIQASYVDLKPAIAGTNSGEFGTGYQLIANTTTTEEPVQGFTTNNESAIGVPMATDGNAQETLTDSGGLVTYPRGNDQALPETMLFPTASSNLGNPVPLVSVLSDYVPTFSHLPC
ncbi:hypothetical protein GP486_002794 [Trichoglossum hirsutum]|uniref:Uncharacterized protein n=1 Tax=Trichoglossum hirsutum TaxID=265104 RepID=A0A9P8LEK2_9PEZI|nr:hypothetical protein GP486_002794 [Trichoglossum hirsutum]